MIVFVTEKKTDLMIFYNIHELLELLGIVYVGVTRTQMRIHTKIIMTL